MADSSHPGAQLRLLSAPAELHTPAQELPAARELIIDVRVDWWVRYEGTAAQLIEEGIVPSSQAWPQGATDKRWKANGFDYWLRRARPEGHKGPMRSWLALDNWRLHVTVTGRDYQWRTLRELQRKSEALRAEYHRHTPEGQSARFQDMKRFWKAREDDAFQAFKAAVLPQRKKPVRKPKEAAAAANSQGAQA